MIKPANKPLQIAFDFLPSWLILSVDFLNLLNSKISLTIDFTFLMPLKLSNKIIFELALWSCACLDIFFINCQRKQLKWQLLEL